MKILCPGCRRERELRSRGLCNSCAETVRRYGGPHTCQCGQPTYQNHSNWPKVVCLDCFHGDLEVIKTHCMVVSDLQTIEKCVRLSRGVIRKYYLYFCGQGELPRDPDSYAPETLALLLQYRTEVMTFFRAQRQRAG